MCCALTSAREKPSFRIAIPKRSTYKALTRVIPYRHKPLVKPAVIAIPRRATYEALARVIPHGLTVGLGVFGSFGSFGWLSWFAPLVSAV